MKKIQLETGFKAEAAFHAIFDKFSTELLSYIYYLTNNKAVAEELANESFFALYHSKDSYNPKLKLKPWLWRIGRNKAYNYIKKKKEINLEELENPSEQNSSAVDQVEDNSLDQLESLITKQTHESVKTAICELPLMQKEALELWIQDFSFEEIADLLGKSPQAVKNLIHRAKQALVASFSPKDTL